MERHASKVIKLYTHGWNGNGKRIVQRELKLQLDGEGVVVFDVYVDGAYVQGQTDILLNTLEKRPMQTHRMLPVFGETFVVNARSIYKFPQLDTHSVLRDVDEDGNCYYHELIWKPV